MSTRTPADRYGAIRFLAGAVPQETLDDVRLMMQNRQTPWHLASHFGLGLQVRNALRGAGFKWSDIFLDDHWYRLVEEAARSASRGG